MTGANMKHLGSTKFSNEVFHVRSLEPRDLTAAIELFPDAIIHLHPIRSEADPEPSLLHEVFSGRQSAWVAEAEERLIGMAVLSIDSQTLARLTYLHVASDYPRHVPAATALAETAIRKAWDAGCLKLAIHTPVPANHLAQYMHDLGFEFARAHSSGSQRVLEYYRNLYQLPRDPLPGLETFDEFIRE